MKKKNITWPQIIILYIFVKYGSLKIITSKSTGNSHFLTMFGSSLLLCSAITFERTVQFQWNKKHFKFYNSIVLSSFCKWSWFCRIFSLLMGPQLIKLAKSKYKYCKLVFKTRRKAFFTVDITLSHLTLQLQFGLIRKKHEEGANHTQLTARFET